MRSALVATTLASAVVADTAGTVGVAGSYNDCVSTCKPVLDVSSQCGLPVPANYQFALDPNTWANYNNFINPAAWNGQTPASALSVGWSTATGAGTAVGAGTAAGAGGWGGWGGWSGAAGGAGYGGGALGGNAWSNGWNVANWMSPQSVQCVCSSKAIDIKAIGAGCTTCLNKVNSVANPWLNNLATSCNFAGTGGVVPGVGAGTIGTGTVGTGTVGTGGWKSKREANTEEPSDDEPAPESQQRWGQGGQPYSWGSGQSFGSGGSSGGSIQASNGQGGSPVFFSGAQKMISDRSLFGLAIGGTAAAVVFLL